MNNDSIIKKLNDIFKKHINYDNINKHNDIKLRKSKVDLHDLFYFAFKYSYVDLTKQEIINSLNVDNNKSIYYTSYVRKLNNINNSIFKNLLNDITNLHLQIFTPKDFYFYAVDGTYNINESYLHMLNLSIFDVYENIPIDITCHGSDSKNKEIKYFKEFLESFRSNINFHKCIFICDRLYASYELIKYLIDINAKFIIRIRESQKDILNRKIYSSIKKKIKNCY